MFTTLRTAFLALLLSNASLCSRAQTNCLLFKDSSHIKACRLYNATDSLPQGSRICQQYLDSAIRLCPEYAEAWREISVPYLKRGDYRNWRKYMDRAVKLKPLAYTAVRGWCRFKFLRDYEGALFDLQKADTLSGFQPGQSGDGSYNLYIVMALCERELGNYTAAFRYFALGIDSVRARRGKTWLGLFDYLHRAVMEIKLKDYDKALSDLDLQSEIYDRYAETEYYRSMVFTATGHPQQARASLERARRLFITDGYHLSDIYCEMTDEVHLVDIETALSKLDPPTLLKL